MRVGLPLRLRKNNATAIVRKPKRVRVLRCSGSVLPLTHQRSLGSVNPCRSKSSYRVLTHVSLWCRSFCSSLFCVFVEVQEHDHLDASKIRATRRFSAALGPSFAVPHHQSHPSLLPSRIPKRRGFLGGLVSLTKDSRGGSVWQTSWSWHSLGRSRTRGPPQPNSRSFYFQNSFMHSYMCVPA